jgi:hypothetical protein
MDLEGREALGQTLLRASSGGRTCTVSHGAATSLQFSSGQGEGEKGHRSILPSKLT